MISKSILTFPVHRGRGPFDTVDFDILFTKNTYLAYIWFIHAYVCV